MDDQHSRAQARSVAILGRVNESHLNNWIKRAIAEPAPSKKIVWLRRLANTLVDAVGDEAPCRDGCSHCCFTSVLISSTEARRISKETGKAMRIPEKWRHKPTDSFTGVPCPFLKNNRCGIYEHRPFICRTQFSLADTNEPCDTSKGIQSVPYFDSRPLHAAYIAALGKRAVELADIRDFF